MKGLKRFMKSENGAYSTVEASFIYPIVFLVIFVLIYIGLHILQMITVASYAQKISILAAREVSMPGYRSLLDKQRYSSAAAEADFETDPVKGTETEGGETKKPFENKISISNKVDQVKLRAYRYWYDPLNNSEKDYYREFGRELVKKNSILNGLKAEEVKVSIDCDNYLITQFINVKIEQQLMDFPVLDYFGIDSPKIKITSVATVSDTDELVRNTDFAVDSVEAVAEKLGIDPSHVKKTVKSAMKKLGLIN